VKYFTREWAAGDLSDEATDAARRLYSERLEVVLPRLPSTVRELASRVNLHDALLFRVQVSTTAEELALELVGGDFQSGYSDIRLEYSGVDLGAIDLGALSSIARDRRTEVLYDEVDLLDEALFEHRILFWPRGDVAISFRRLKLAISSRPDRAMPFVGDPFVVLHE
jgi:hypothetical protein